MYTHLLCHICELIILSLIEFYFLLVYVKCRAFKWLHAHTVVSNKLFVRSGHVPFNFDLLSHCQFGSCEVFMERGGDIDPSQKSRV